METAKKLARYIVAGGTGAIVHLSVLTALVELLNIYPVLASIGGFLCAFGVSFSLQKFWTFRNHDRATAPRQMMIYFGIQVVNLGLNVLLMYAFIEWVGIQYFVAQVATIGLLAIESYVLYSKVVFRAS